MLKHVMYTLKRKSLISGLHSLECCTSSEGSFERFAIDIAGPKILLEVVLYRK